MTLLLTKGNSPDFLETACSFVYKNAGGAWLGLYEQRIGRELTADEIAFAYCFYQQASWVIEKKASE
jgi:hypothetical protein